MTLVEAIKKTNTGQGIRRKKWGNVFIVPTNTEKCCIVFEGDKFLSECWNPQKEDLIADDWILA